MASNLQSFEARKQSCKSRAKTSKSMKRSIGRDQKELQFKTTTLGGTKILKFDDYTSRFDMMNIHREFHDIEYEPNYDLTRRRDDRLCMDFSKTSERKPFYLTSVTNTKKKIEANFMEKIMKRKINPVVPK